MSQPRDFSRRRADALPPDNRNRQAGTQDDGQSHKAAGWGESIRALYDGVLHEPLPADFTTLLEELKKKTL